MNNTTLTDSQFQSFFGSLSDACRKTQRGTAERQAAIARFEEFNAELTRVQVETKGGKQAVLVAVAELCRRFGYEG